MPVAKIADMAHAHNIEVICDGAHSFGLLDFKIPDLHCDYFGTSLHKFLSAPIGTGMMWVKADKIEKLWPLVCNSGIPTRPTFASSKTWARAASPWNRASARPSIFTKASAASARSSASAISRITGPRARKQSPRSSCILRLNLNYSCAICGVSIDGMTPGQLSARSVRQVQDSHRRHCWENISCVRVTPHVYTPLPDLDKLVTALEEIAAKAIILCRIPADPGVFAIQPPDQNFLPCNSV
jgi:selenocysteine lyase/cysteine desulfurase